MPLQNRVTPFGDIVSTPERGLFVGNRGIIHDPSTRTLLSRRWTSKAWICCALKYKGRRREVMGQRSWTELFFLDEATALAAGHRPCFECRRADAMAFRDAWAAGNRLTDRPRAAQMDAILHDERLDGRGKRLNPLDRPSTEFPDGVMIAVARDSVLVLNGRLFRWSPGGYHEVTAPEGEVRLLTPPSVVRALQAGYRPALHPTALAGQAFTVAVGPATRWSPC